MSRFQILVWGSFPFAKATASNFYPVPRLENTFQKTGPTQHCPWSFSCSVLFHLLIREQGWALGKTQLLCNCKVNKSHPCQFISNLNKWTKISFLTFHNMTNLPYLEPTWWLVALTLRLIYTGSHLSLHWRPIEIKGGCSEVRLQTQTAMEEEEG